MKSEFSDQLKHVVNFSYLLMGLNIHDRDYDDRTALHVAASEGDVACLEYLLSKWRESPGRIFCVFTCESKFK